MLKKPLIVLVTLCLCLLFAPSLAQAASRKPVARSESRLTMPRILSVLEVWWNVWRGVERTGDTAIQEKNGCGIDPNGQPLCGEGGGPAGGAGMNEDPTVGGTGG